MRAVPLSDDLAVLAAVLGAAAVVLLAVHLVRAALHLARPPRPSLPDDDAPPAGLGRLVPEGAAVLHEARRGAVALELWLTASHRRRLSSGDASVPRRWSAGRTRAAAGSG